MKNRFKYILIFFAIFFQLQIFANDVVRSVKLTPAEYKLYELIMEYRAEYGLPNIPLSSSLTYVAQTHVRDLSAHPPKGECNLHSWSPYGNWTPCCYTPDHAQAKNMWNKPSELTPYKSNGYEIAARASYQFTPEDALRCWQGSPGHNNVIINRSIWTNRTWRAIGIGMYNNYAVVWFGEAVDPIPYTKGKPQSEIVEPQRNSNGKIILQLPDNTNMPSVADETEVTTQPLMQTLGQKEERQKEEQQRAEELKHAEQQQKEEQQKDKEQSFSYTVKNDQTKSSSNTLNTFNTTKTTKTTNNSTTNKLTSKTSLRDRYYTYSGRSTLSYLGLGCTYSFADTVHLMTISLLDFRSGLFGMSPLAVEMAVTPHLSHFVYKPAVKLYLPLANCLSVVAYAGVLVDASYLGTCIWRDYEYVYNRDFFLNGYCGVAVNLSALRRMPMEVKLEYRFPVPQLSYSEYYSSGLYLSAQLYLGSAFRR
jgi:hypothetical protein